MTITVYAITSGIYSDYTVRALFTTRELAEEAIVRARAFDTSDDWNEVEEYLLHEAVPQPVSVCGRSQNLWDDGSETEPAWEYINTGFPWDYGVDRYERLRRPEVQFIRAPIHNAKGGRLEVRGRTLVGVRKAFHDRHAEWKAWTVGVADKPRWVGGGA